MNIKVLAIGDITGKSGLDFLCKKLNEIKTEYDISFTVVNSENSAGLGMKPKHAGVLVSAGIDVITLGNHTWTIKEIKEQLDSNPRIIRPANFVSSMPGKGWDVYETDFGDICVINLIGRADMPNSYVCENPFFEMDNILNKVKTKMILVDLHAETTSEKYAMAYYLDGRVSALWGTHTHVQTSDACIFPKGMGYITDLGMTGAVNSIIGMNPEKSLARFLGNPSSRFECAEGVAKLEGAVIEIDTITGKCINIQAIRVFE